MKYHINLSAFDCSFYMYINDIPFLDMRRAGNTSTTMFLNKFLVNNSNVLTAKLNPAPGEDALSASSYLRASIYYEDTATKEKIVIKEISTPVFGSDDKIPVPDFFNLIDYFIVESIPDDRLLSGTVITDSVDFQELLMKKYDLIWKYFQEKDMANIKTFFNERDIDYGRVFEKRIGQQEAETEEDYANYLNNSSLDLWVMKKEKMVFKIYLNGKLACYELKNGNSPLCFVNNAEQYAIYIKMYFQLNPITNDFVVIR